MQRLWGGWVRLNGVLDDKDVILKRYTDVLAASPFRRTHPQRNRVKQNLPERPKSNRKNNLPGHLCKDHNQDQSG